jgi:hypothetical protein
MARLTLSGFFSAVVTRLDRATSIPELPDCTSVLWNTGSALGAGMTACNGVAQCFTVLPGHDVDGLRRCKAGSGSYV